METLLAYVSVLKKLRENHGAWLHESGFRSEVGPYFTSTVLRISKPAWSREPKTKGIFFSVWLDEPVFSGKGKRVFHYNLHALKVGLLPNYKVKPVTFAKLFRSKFETGSTGLLPLAPSETQTGNVSSNDPWPNVSIDYGPQTLFQGWKPLVYETFEADVSNLITKFVELSPLIDELLDRSKRL